MSLSARNPSSCNNAYSLPKGWKRDKIPVSTGELNRKGQHLNIQADKLLFLPVQPPSPPLYFGGSSPAAKQVPAKHVDPYFTWGEALKISGAIEKAID